MIHLANFLRFLANLLDHPAKTRFISIGNRRFAMRDDLPFIITAE